MGKKLATFTLKRKSAPVSQQIIESNWSDQDLFRAVEDTLSTPLEQAQYVVGYGIIKAKLRDEIYCQLCKQLNRNEDKQECCLKAE